MIKLLLYLLCLLLAGILPAESPQDTVLLGEGTIAKCSGMAALMDAPAADAARLAGVPRKAAVTVYDDGDEQYYLCVYKDQTGYIVKTDVSVSEVAP